MNSHNSLILAYFTICLNSCCNTCLTRLLLPQQLSKTTNKNKVENTMKITQKNGRFTVQYQGIKTISSNLVIAIETAVRTAQKRAAFRTNINSLGA